MCPWERYALPNIDVFWGFFECEEISPEITANVWEMFAPDHYETYSPIDYSPSGLSGNPWDDDDNDDGGFGVHSSPISKAPDLLQR